MLACDDTITLVKCDGETYTATVFDLSLIHISEPTRH